MTERRKRGRPIKPAGLRRVQRLQLLLTLEEHKSLSAYAARQGMTASEIVRGCLRRLLETDATALENGRRQS
jgi:hypothetical protein